MLALLVTQVALASGGSEAAAGGGKQLKKLKQRLAAVEQELATIKGGQGAPAAPTGAAGGDLSGTYPNPQIGPGAVGGPELAEGSVTGAKLADDAVAPANLLPLGSAAVNASPIQAVPFVVKAEMVTASINNGNSGSLTFYNANAPVDFRVIDAWTVTNTPPAEPFTWRLRQGAAGPGVTSDTPLGATTGAVSRTASFDPLSDQVVLAGDSLTVEVTNVGVAPASTFLTIYVLAVPFSA